MNVVDTLFKHYAIDPQRLSEKLIQALPADSDELSGAAQRWCDLVAPLSDDKLERLGNAYRFMRLASESNAPFEAFLDKAEHSGARDLLVRAMLVLYAKRNDPSAWNRLLVDWVRVESMRDEFAARVPIVTAEAFCEYPALAYELIAELVESRWLRGAEANPRLAAAAIALRRRLRDYPEHAMDREALAGPTGEEYFDHFREQLHALLAVRKPIPAGVWTVVDRRLRVDPGADVEWYEALWLNAASVDRQNTMVAFVADRLERAANPARWFEAASGYCVGHSGLFSGPGWGREGLGRKLLPIARVFVRRKEWPTASWLCCFEATVVDRNVSLEDRAQARYERVKDVLAEALLERALDSNEELATRSRAVRALGKLSPTGKASTIRALGKLHEHSELGTIAKAAQKEARDRARLAVLDAELTLMDAWVLFTER